MAYTAPFLRLVAIGTLYGTETFSWSVAFAQPVGGGADAPAVVPEGVITAVSNFHAAAIGIGTASRLTTIKLNLIGTDGRYVSSGDTVLHEFETPLAGTGTSSMPAQNALAITLATSATRGRAARGRFYIPRLVSGLETDGRLAGPTASGIAVQATNMLDGVAAALPGWRPAVMSNIGSGTTRPVNHVEVGRVVDTIRSRRTSLEEEREPGAVLGGWTGDGGPF